MKTCWRLTQATLKAWYEDNALEMGAALAYYAVFSIPPLLLISLAVMGALYSGNSLGYMHEQMEPLIGTNAADAVATIMRSVHSSRHGSGITLASVFTLFVGASAMCAQFQNSMNQIWGVQSKSGNLVKDLIKQRLWSFAIVLGIALLLLASLMWSLILSWIAGFLQPAMNVAVHIVDLVVSFGSVAVLLAATYKIVPDVKIRWADVWVGATVTAALYLVGKFAIGFYLSRSGIGSAYGAAGSILIVLAWIYYVSQILFLGAEFTKAYALLHRVHKFV